MDPVLSLAPPPSEITSTTDSDPRQPDPPICLPKFSPPPPTTPPRSRRPIWDTITHTVARADKAQEKDDEEEDDYAWYYTHPERYIRRPRPPTCTSRHCTNPRLLPQPQPVLVMMAKSSREAARRCDSQSAMLRLGGGTRTSVEMWCVSIVRSTRDL